MVPPSSRSFSNLQLQSENKVLHKVWIAGVNPQEFTRIVKSQEVELLSISLLCDDILRGINNSQKKKHKLTASAFMELHYLVSGIIFLYRSQATFLYDQVCQLKFSLEFVRRSSGDIFCGQSQTTKLTKTKRSRKNSDPVDNLPIKQIRLSNDTPFEWKEDLNDMKVDNESTILMLQKSKVMNRDQICLRETAEEPTLDLTFQDDEYDVAENGNTQNFLEIRDLVSRGSSITHIIQNEGFNPLSTQDRMDTNFEESEDQYQPITSQHDDEPNDPLPDIETYQQELDVDIMPQNIEDDANNFKKPNIPSRFNALEVVSGNNLENPSTVADSTKKGTKRRRHRFIDYPTQIPISEMTTNRDKKMMRCVSGRLDCISDDYLLLRSLSKLFNKPTHMTKELKPRNFKDTTPLMVGIQRAKRLKRKEEVDLVMKNDFLNAINYQPQQDELVVDTIAQLPEPDVPKPIAVTIVNRRKDNKKKTRQIDDESSLNEPVFEHQDEPMYESEPEFQSNIPSPIHTEPDELKQLSYKEHSNTYRHKPMKIPATVLKVLDKFATNTTNKEDSYGSQSSFVMKNQQNRENWGLKGVLSQLFGLWNSHIYPVGMKELMQPNRQKLAAALAFYSIMELNSPRIGLILIEKYPNSNIVFNIKQSPKLINLL